MHNTPAQPSHPAPPHFLRRRLACTLLLALAAASAELWDAANHDSLPMLLLLALLCSATAWEGWRADGSKGHLMELCAGLLFPWLMLLTATSKDLSAETITRQHGASFACWAVVALAILIRDGIHLRGLGMALTQQSVARDMLRFLYPVGFLGLAFFYPALVIPLVTAYLFYRFWRTLTGRTRAALILTAATVFAQDVVCKTLAGNAHYGLPNVLQLGRDDALFVAGISLILAALLLPCVKAVRFFRNKLGGVESPLPVLGFLGDILALPALPCALIALLLLIRWTVLGAGSALNF